MLERCQPGQNGHAVEGLMTPRHHLLASAPPDGYVGFTIAMAIVLLGGALLFPLQELYTINVSPGF